jgi:hypothetical protein
MLKWLIALTVALVPYTSFASGTFCSGFSVHYSESHVDLGVPPPQGLRLGEIFLSADGETLGKIELFADAPPVGSFPYTVELTEKKVLAREGNITWGWEVFSADLTATGPGDSKPVQEQVVCKTSWALVP